MEFKPRLTKPEAGNKYYIRKADGGYSDAILGKPTDPDCNTLANCSGYSYSRFNEVGQWGYCKYLAPVNAGIFMDFKGDCATGFDPKLGACAVWRKNGSTSSGHVASVEQIIDNDTIVCSESSYNGQAFYLRTRHRKDGNWEQDGYTFKGFIYNPAVPDELDWQKAYTDLNAKYGELEATLINTRNDLEQTETRLFEAVRKAESALAEAEKLECEKTNLQANYNTVCNSLVAEKSKLTAAQGEANSLKVELASTKALMQTMQEAAKNMSDKYEAEISDLNDKLKAKDDYASILTEQINALEKTAEDTKAKYEKEIEKLKKKLEDVKTSHKTEIEIKEQQIVNLRTASGDINGDGKVNFLDVICLLIHLFKKKGEKS